MNIIAAVISAIIIIFGFAGGGGSSSGGGGGGGYSGGSSYSHSSSSSSSSDDETSSGEAVFYMVVFIIALAVILLTSKKKFTDHNSTPEEQQIHQEAERIFRQYQEDWTNFNISGIKKYTTPDYYQHASLMLELLKDLHRVNRVSDVKVEKVNLLNAVDGNTSLPTAVQITYQFAGLDEVIDTNSNQLLYKNRARGATETWNYLYDGKSLKLSGISQPTESAPHLVKSLADFASQNHLYYSPDWGRYALPSRGLIFGGASMRIADINNHIIGKWSLNSAPTSAQRSASRSSATSVKSDGLLIQMYTYAESPNQSTRSYFLVGQINVPKDYLGVIVKSRRFKTYHKPDRSHEKFELEWNDFNERYEVYAASRDALPAFELLNPKFMEFLYSKNPSYNLEVVDNVIYIYAKITNVSEQDYSDMLEVLRRAYDELKM
ncbi:MAG: hypothetical protein Q4B87_02350 [Candidatus Saccharibacteria bacterium]|nr:hypothetical protein [Candidatus Saccharibacteria bacterium]